MSNLENHHETSLSKALKICDFSWEKEERDNKRKLRVSIRIFTCKRQKLTLANKSRNRNLWTFPRAPRIIGMIRELALEKPEG